MKLLRSNPPSIVSLIDLPASTKLTVLSPEAGNRKGRAAGKLPRPFLTSGKVLICAEWSIVVFVLLIVVVLVTK